MFEQIKYLKAKIQKHRIYYDKKFADYKKMDKNKAQAFSRLRRLTLLSGLIMDLIHNLFDLEMQFASRNKTVL